MAYKIQKLRGGLYWELKLFRFPTKAWGEQMQDRLDA